MSGVLYHSPERIIMEYLVLQGFGINPDDYNPPQPVEIPGEPLQQFDIPNGLWPIYDGREPDNPDEVIRLIGTTGRSFGYTQVDSERQEMDGIQVYVRGLDKGKTRLKCLDVALALDRITREQINLPVGEVSGTGTSSANYLIQSVSRTTEVVYAGRDVPQGKRIVYTTNALTVIRMCHLF